MVYRVSENPILAGTPMQNLHAIILAAGRGKRMQSDLPKVLHVLGQRPLLWHVLDQVKESGITSATVVISYKKELVEESVNNWAKANPGLSVNFADQGEPKGTGHAVLICEPHVPAGKNIAVCLGDVPGIRAKTLGGIYAEFAKTSPSALVVSMKLDNPTGYGRIVRANDGLISGIVEERDASDAIKTIAEVNTGIFFFNGQDIWPALKKIQPQNAQGEYYLTDIVQILLKDGKKVSAYLHPQADEFRGVNSQDDLNQMAQTAPRAAAS
jgi:UDP-N-acetylglucosamine diphosphorylase/glucosamine-1-phosphate N-acetyltransferase